MIGEDDTLPRHCSHFQLYPCDYTPKNVDSKGDILLKLLNRGLTWNNVFGLGVGSVWRTIQHGRRELGSM